MRLIAVLLSLAVSPILRAICPAGCAPVQKSGYQPISTLLVGVDSSANISQGDLDAIKGGMDYWNAYFFARGMPPVFQWQSSAQYGPPNILIVVQPSLSGTGDVAVFTHMNNDPTNPNGTLALNPDYLNRNNTPLLGTVGDHEFGHALGFDHVTNSGCQGSTVMYPEIDKYSGPFFGPSQTECDRQAERTTFPPHTGSGGIDGPGGCYELDCTDPSPWNPDPLVLDLNNDGINTSGTDDLVWFDLDGNGAKDHITWTNAKTVEGFLWINLTGKNRVDNGSELLGIGTVLPDGKRAADGFQALGIYDQPAQRGNGDGAIDAEDGVWNQLRVWVDANHNGICEASEVWPLHKFGIQGISLAAVPSTYVDQNGNGHHLRGQYWRHIGSRLELFDIDSVSFQGEHH